MVHATRDCLSFGSNYICRCDCDRQKHYDRFFELESCILCSWTKIASNSRSVARALQFLEWNAERNGDYSLNVEWIDRIRLQTPLKLEIWTEQLISQAVFVTISQAPTLTASDSIWPQKQLSEEKTQNSIHSHGRIFSWMKIVKKIICRDSLSMKLFEVA